jgi:hypothetical protein
MDEKDELIISARDGQDVHKTVNTKGWQKVIKPALENRMNSLVNEFANASGYEELVRIQQAINAIKGLTDFIEIKLMEGKQALEELGKNK